MRLHRPAPFAAYGQRLCNCVQQLTGGGLGSWNTEQWVYVYAVDATGIIFLQVTAETGDSTSSRRLNRISADSAHIDFSLRVPGDAPVDAVVTVHAIARDTQDFEVTFTDTVIVRVGVSPP